MKRAFLLLIGFFFYALAQGQRSYFIYVQSESGLPFYVKFNNAVHSSAASGYLILSKLKDSTYTIKLGFPQDKFPEQEFTIVMGGQDHGLLLKNFGENDWGLFDLQSLNITKAAGNNTGADVAKTNTGSSFTEILSQATNDPALIEKPAPPVKKEEPVKTDVTTAPAQESKPVAQETKIVVKEEKVVPEPEKKVEPVVVTTPPTTEVKTETNVAATTDKVSNTVAEDMAPLAKSTIVKRSESSTTAGFGLLFLDTYEDGVLDTISLLIPPVKTVVVEDVAPAKKQEEKKFLDVVEEKKQDSSSLIKPTISTNNEVIVKDPTPIVEPTTTAENKETVVPVPPTKQDSVMLEATEEKQSRKKKKKFEDEDVQAPAPEVKPQFENTACTSAAGDNDFIALRKKMVAEETDDNMIDVAKKAMKSKCYTTQQIKNLSVLLLNDAAKYEFFDMAYKYVVDPSKFSTLQSEIKDEYYIKRFLAMLK